MDGRLCRSRRIIAKPDACGIAAAPR